MNKGQFMEASGYWHWNGMWYADTRPRRRWLGGIRRPFEIPRLTREGELKSLEWRQAELMQKREWYEQQMELNTPVGRQQGEARVSEILEELTQLDQQIELNKDWEEMSDVARDYLAARSVKQSFQQELLWDKALDPFRETLEEIEAGWTWDFGEKSETESVRDENAEVFGDELEQEVEEDDSASDLDFESFDDSETDIDADASDGDGEGADSDGGSDADADGDSDADSDSEGGTDGDSDI